MDYIYLANPSNKELIPAQGLTIQILAIPVHPRPPKTFQHPLAHSKNHFPEVKNTFLIKKRGQKQYNEKKL